MSSMLLNTWLCAWLSNSRYMPLIWHVELTQRQLAQVEHSYT